MIRKCGPEDEDIIFYLINKAAKLYKGVIPDDCYHEPYMSKGELRHEMKNMTFYGYEKENELVGVMALQPLGDVTLIRHSYILPEHQQKGIGSMLLNYLKQISPTDRLLVGTWKNAKWATRFYQKHNFKLLPDKDRLLKKYWDIPKRQVETSVVLGMILKKADY